jgi:pilus assembly protein CpaE
MRAIVICPDLELRSSFEKVAADCTHLKIAKSCAYYPQADEFRRLVRVWNPEVVFISMETVGAAEPIVEQLDLEFPTIQRVALSETEDPAILRQAMQFGMVELVAPPMDALILARLVKRVNDHLALRPVSVWELGRIFAFMPAKGGVGASTIAANAALAFAQDPESRVLLADLDIYSGLMSFLFKTEHHFSIRDAAQGSKALDDDGWQNLVKRVGNLDLLLSGAPAVDSGISASQLEPVLDFARRSYSVICADIADAFDERSTVVLREASSIFMVTTPDLASLRLAKLKAACLRKLEWDDKARLVINRVNSRMELTIGEIEKIVGLPVCATMPCDYGDVTRATRSGQASPKLAPSIRAFVEKLLDKKILETRRPRFIERFTVAPAPLALRALK